MLRITCPTRLMGYMDCSTSWNMSGAVLWAAATAFVGHHVVLDELESVLQLGDNARPPTSHTRNKGVRDLVLVATQHGLCHVHGRAVQLVPAHDGVDLALKLLLGVHMHGLPQLHGHARDRLRGGNTPADAIVVGFGFKPNFSALNRKVENGGERCREEEDEHGGAPISHHMRRSWTASGRRGTDTYQSADGEEETPGVRSQAGRGEQAAQRQKEDTEARRTCC
ncbi:hypothetical protein GQ600_2187 [Phytophthora cactorum]|nr:hypothetical protein GQ600_2187 [Phytophthora cactorum]